jgi:hypothetical protein
MAVGLDNKYDQDPALPVEPATVTPLIDPI